jgi:hypothetical protein
VPFAFRRRELSPLSVPRAHAAAVALPGGRAAIVGGNTGPLDKPASGSCEETCWSSAAVDIVDLATGAVVAGPALREPREGATVAWRNGRILVAGGLADHG